MLTENSRRPFHLSWHPYLLIYCVHPAYCPATVTAEDVVGEVESRSNCELTWLRPLHAIPIRLQLDPPRNLAAIMYGVPRSTVTVGYGQLSQKLGTCFLVAGRQRICRWGCVQQNLRPVSRVSALSVVSPSRLIGVQFAWP